MNLRGVSVLLVFLITSLAPDIACAFLWGSNDAAKDNNAPSNEKPTISLSCLLYGDVGCRKACQLTSLLYDAEINPKCQDNVYCLCNEVYHMPGGDLTQNDFRTVPFDTLWDNNFENTSQANAIRRYIKKNPEMLTLVDSLIRDPHVNGEEVKTQLMFSYPDLTPEFKKLVSIKRGLKSDLLGDGDHLKYEDILDHFNELVTGIQTSDNELQNIKYRRRIGKILESINDESELGHLIDLVKLSQDESLYNYVTSVLKRQGYVLDSDLDEAIPIVEVFPSAVGDQQVVTTNVIREHNLGVDDINENDMIELSVITNLAKASNDHTISIQITQDDGSDDDNQPPSVMYREAVETRPSTSVTYNQVTSNDNIDNDVVAMSETLAQMQVDIANLGAELNQLKSSSSSVTSSQMPGMVSGNFASQSTVNQQSVDSALSGINFDEIAQVLNGDLGEQNITFEDGVSAIMNALLGTGTTSNTGTVDAAQLEFLNSIPTYMAQVSNAPVTFPDGVTVSKVFSNNAQPTAGASVPTMVAGVTPEAIENSVQYTISKRVKMANDGRREGPTGITIYDSAREMDTAAPAESPTSVDVTVYNVADTTTNTVANNDGASKTQILISTDGEDTNLKANNYFNTDSTTVQSSSSSAPDVEVKVTQADGDQVTVVSDGATNNVTVQSTTPATTESVAVKSGATSKKTRIVNANSAPKTKIAVAETAAPAKPANSAKPAKVMRKSASSVVSKAPQINSSQASSGPAVLSVNSEQEVGLDEVPAVIESVANVKRRQSSGKRNAEQSESSSSSTSSVVKSVSSTSSSSSTVQADDDSAVNNNTSVTTKTETSTTHQAESANNNVYYAMGKGNVENSVPVVQAQENPSTIGRFGDHVRRFANSFKKSSSS